MIKQISFLLLLLTAVMLPSQKSLAATSSPSGLLCVADVMEVEKKVRGKKRQHKKYTKARRSKKAKRKGWWKKKLAKTFLGALGLGLIGFLIRRKKKKIKNLLETMGNDGGGLGGIIVTVLLLAALIWFFAASGFSWQTILLILGIAILALAIIIGLIVLAVRNM
ncbi:MAG: hypothetical protein AAFV95_01945 [Bacteroidota bacterium]